MSDSMLVLRIPSTSLPEKISVRLQLVQKTFHELSVGVWTHSVAAFQAQPGDLCLLVLLRVLSLRVAVDVFFVFIIATVLATGPI